MPDEKTYLVTVELEVTAENKEEAKQFAFDDMKELMSAGSLEASVKQLHEGEGL